MRIGPCETETDCQCQQRPFVFDIPEFVRFVIITLITCPPNYLWQQWLERTFPGRKDAEHDDGIDLAERGKEKVDEPVTPKPKGNLNWRNTMTKWFIDCITLGAIFNTIAFLILINLLKGNRPQIMMRAIKNVRQIGSLFFPLAMWLCADSVPGNNSYHSGRIQSLADCVHNQLQLDTRGKADSLLERGWTMLGYLHELGGSEAMMFDFALGHGS
jgi:hypothetical protein